jgi:succinate dehydrogenase / fumarate reductase cytochrome b subunit
MPDVNRGNRPLSPFMLGQFYRLQLNSVTSILTRITGNAMLVAAFLIVWWLLAAATSADYYTTVNAVITSFLGDIVMFLSLWGLWYHSLAGLRHLYWDTGRGLDIRTADMLGWGVVGGSVVLTLLTVIII